MLHAHCCWEYVVQWNKDPEVRPSSSADCVCTHVPGPGLSWSSLNVCFYLVPVLVAVLVLFTHCLVCVCVAVLSVEPIASCLLGKHLNAEL